MRTSLAIIADDLSGAAETVGALAAGADAELVLRARRRSSAAVVAIDIDTRGRPEAEARDAFAAALSGLPPHVTVYKKIDSLLRGHVGIEMQVLRELGHRVVVVTALPRLGRTSMGGVVHLDGVPLHATAAWSHESRPAPPSIPEALRVPSAVVSTDVVRAGDLGAALAAAFASDLVAVCDAETESDLESIASVLEPGVTIVASAGLARVLGPRLRLAPAEPRFAPDAARIVTVVGSQTASAAAQVARAAAAQCRLAPGESPVLDGGDAVVTLTPGAWADSALDSAFIAIAQAIRRLPGRTDLVLTGGDTARRVLDALGIDVLLPEHEVEDGAVLSMTERGFAVVTRPGSYGAPDSLQRIIGHLKGTP